MLVCLFFVCFLRAVNALASLRNDKDSPEPSMLDNVVSIKLSCAFLLHVKLCKTATQNRQNKDLNNKS